MYNFAERMQRVRAISGGTNVSLGKLLDCSTTAAKTYAEGSRKPDAEILMRLLEKMPNLSAEWLMRGTGPMLLNGEGEIEVEETPQLPECVTKAENAVKVVNDTVSQINEVKLDFYMKDNNRLQIELQEMKNKIKKLEDRNILLQDKLLEKL